MLVLAQTDRERATLLDGSLWADTPAFALRESKRARDKDYYRKGIAAEFLRDYERVQGLEADRSERLMMAASVLVSGGFAVSSGFYALTPNRIITSRPCQLFVRCDLEPTLNQTLLNLNPAPTLTLRGNLTQRLGIRVEIDAINSGALGDTTLKISFDDGRTYAITGYVTTSTITQILDTGVYLSCGVGPYLVGNVWVATLNSLADQSLLNANADFVNSNVSTQFTYTACDDNIRKRASMTSSIARNTRFLSMYVPPDPGVTPTLISWVGMAPSWTNTASIWAAGDVNQMRLRQGVASPQIAMSGAVAVNNTAAMVLGTYFGGESYWSNSAADRLRIGTTAIAGGVSAASGVPAGGFCLSARPNGNLPADYVHCELSIFTGGDATALELARLRAYKTILFGCAA